MKIAIFTMQFGQGYSQGTEKYIKNLVDGLRTNGHQVDIFAGDPEKLRPKNSKTLPTYGWEAFETPVARSLRAKVIRSNYDIIHLIHPGHIGVGIAKLAKELQLPFYITITDFWWGCPKFTRIKPNHEFCDGFKPADECIACVATASGNVSLTKLSRFRYLKLCIKKLFKAKLILKNQYSYWQKRKALTMDIFKSAESVICLSNYALAYHKAHLKAKNLIYIPVGINQCWFKKVQSSSKCEQRLRLGFIGRIAPHKGLHILIKALQGLDNKFDLWIAGEFENNEYKNMILTLLRHSGLKPVFVGYLEETDLVDFVDNLDVAVIPSLSPENQPQSALECLARRIPIIVANVPGCAELVHEEWTYEKTNPQSLNTVLRKFLKRERYAFPHSPKACTEMTYEVLSLYEVGLNKKIMKGK